MPTTLQFVLKTGIVLTRTFTANVRTVREAVSEKPFPPGHYDMAGGGGGMAFMLGAGGGGSFLGFFWRPTQTEPTGSAEEGWTVKVGWSGELMLQGGSPQEFSHLGADWYEAFDDDDAIGSYWYDDTEASNHGYSELPEIVNFNTTAAITMTVSGTFKLWGAYSSNDLPDPYENFNPWWNIWKQYGNDHDPHGMTPHTLRMWLEPTSAISVEITAPGKAWDIDIDAAFLGYTQAQFNALFNNGFTGMNLWGFCNGVGGNALGMNNTYTFLDMDIGGFNGSGSAGNSTLTNAQGHSTVSYAGTGSAGTFQVAGDGDRLNNYNGKLEWFLAPLDKVYSGFARHFDETDSGPSPTVKLNETDGPTYNVTDGDIEVTGHTINKTVHYQGWWILYDINQTYTNKKVMDGAIATTVGGVTDGGYYHLCQSPPASSGWGGIADDDLDAIGEPRFPDTEVREPGACYTPNYYSDGRVDMHPAMAECAWADALTFTHDGDLKLYAPVVGCTLDPAASATVEVDGNGWIVITPAEGESNVSAVWALSGVTFAGYRRAELDYEDNDTAALTVYLDSRTWAVNDSTSKLMDLLAPTSQAAGSDDMQSLLYEAASWGWGVHAVAELKVAGMSYPHVYKFKGLWGRRVPAVDGGFMEAIVFNPGSFVGDQAESHVINQYDSHSDRESDPYSMFALQTRQALLVVDGVVAGEIRGVLHEVGTILDEGPPVTMDAATRTYTVLGSASMFTPTDSHVTPTIAETTGWKNDDLETVFLQGGKFTGYASIVIPARLYAARVAVPAELGGQTMNIRKHLRGQVAVRVVEDSGALAVRRVSWATRHVLGGAVLASGYFDTDAVGFGLSPSLPQPLHENDYIHTFSVASGSGVGDDDHLKHSGDGDLYYRPSDGALLRECCAAHVEGTVETRNRNLCFLTLKKD